MAQVRKFCPNTPVILVGCKNDVRFMLNDEQYLNYCRERSPLVRLDYGLVGGKTGFVKSLINLHTFFILRQFQRSTSIIYD